MGIKGGVRANNIGPVSSSRNDSVFDLISHLK
jgi:hypothetical protein